MAVYEVTLSKTYRIREDDPDVAGERAIAYFKQDIIATFGVDFDLGMVRLGLETTIVKGGG